MDLETVRDWVIIVYGIFGIITFLVITAVTAAIGFVVIKLLGTVSSTMENQVTPTLTSVRDTAATVRRRATFVLDAAAAPVIRVYSVAAGVRRGAAVFTGLRRSSRRFR